MFMQDTHSKRRVMTIGKICKAYLTKKAGIPNVRVSYNYAGDNENI